MSWSPANLTMQRACFLLLWLYVFTVPWDVISLPGVGTSTRLAGILVLVAAVILVIATGRFRKPDAILLSAAAFTAMAALSLLWTTSVPTTTDAVSQYVQLAASVWLIRELARSDEERQTLLIAFCLGVLVPLISLMLNFGSTETGTGRYSATGQNADAVGQLLAIAIPMAWYLMQGRRRMVRVLGWVCFILAPLGILLTGTRGAFLSGVVALLVIPLSLGRPTLRNALRVAAVVIVVGAIIVEITPQAAWTRIATIPDEIFGGGSMSTRRDIWAIAFEEFPQHPLLGVGAGAFGVLVEERGRRFIPAHNVLLGIVIEQGVVGLSIFLVLLGACARRIVKLPPGDRRMWALMMLALAVGMMSLSLERWKVTWLLFGLLSAQGGISSFVKNVGQRQMGQPPLRMPLEKRARAGAA